ncbi:glycosyltransferase family 9 protein [candidate division KSB1 bacterium]|nr:glycosyltransferase family 9 protein [candidate division KSB1 bacterium]
MTEHLSSYDSINYFHDFQSPFLKMNVNLFAKQSFLFIQSVAKRIAEYGLLACIEIQPACKKKPHFDKIRKIVVPLFSGIGDAVILTTCLQQLDRLFPDAEITVVETKRTQGILHDTFPKMRFISISSLTDLKKYKREFDLMLSPSRNIDHYRAALILKPTYLVGYNYSLRIRKRESHIHRSNRLLHQLGHKGSNVPVLKLSKQSIEHGNELIQSRIGNDSIRKIALVVGGRWPSKIYPADYYKELISVVLKKSKDVIFLLIGSSVANGEEVGGENPKVVNFSGSISLQETMGIIYRSDLVIAPDGGLLNIAIALNKPIIGLFGAVDPNTIVPEKYLNDVLFINNCPFQPCYNEEHEPLCKMERPFCIEIPAATLIKKVEKLLK